MWQRFDAILQLEAGAYACQDLDTTRLVPKALIRLSPRYNWAHPAVNSALRRRKLKSIRRTTARPAHHNSLKTVQGMIQLRCLGIFDQQVGRRKWRKGTRERGTSSTSPRRVICQGTGGKSLRRRGRESIQTLIISSRPPDSNTLVPLFPKDLVRGTRLYPFQELPRPILATRNEND